MIRTNPNSVRLFLVALITLTGLTWAVGLMDIQYKSETTLAFENGFPGNSAQWKLAGDPHNLTLSSHSVKMERVSDNRSYAMRQFPLPATEKLLNRQLRVRGIITTIKQASRTRINDVAAYMIWFQNENEETIQYTTVQTLTGDFSEYRAERIVSVPTDARAFNTVLINRESDGAFELTDASVTLVEKTLLYKLISPTIFALWASLVLLAVIWLIIKGGYQVGIAIGVFLTLTLLGILIPESVTNNYIFPAYKKFAQTLSLDHSEPLGIYYKIGHFLFFFVVTLTLIVNRQRVQLSIGLTILLMLIFAVATEGLQLHLYNRSTRLSDIGIDMFGVILAVVVGLSIQARTLKPIRINADQAE